ARDGVEPRRARSALGPIRRGGAPDRSERLLRGVLGAAAIAEPAERQPEDRGREAAVERLEGLAVALADPPDQLAVACWGCCCHAPILDGRAGGSHRGGPPDFRGSANVGPPGLRDAVPAL